jgi:hypothetical protein
MCRSPDALTQLAALLRDYPLSERWQVPEVFQETADVAGAGIQLAGLSTQDDEGRMVTGSAAQLAGSPVARAYFELLERTSVLDAIDSVQGEYCLWDVMRVQRGTCPRHRVFPASPNRQRWCYARSNGVAIGRDWQHARRSAAWELTERDSVLRSWYGELRPFRIELSSELVPQRLRAHYDFEAYRFGEATGDTAYGAASPAVVGVFAFPRTPEVPLAYGYGGRDTVAAALAKAAQECIQGLGFLWGEEIPESEPEFSPTPDYHQAFYLHAESHERLWRWLRGEHISYAGTVWRPRGERAASRFVDLTDPRLRRGLFVVKAIPQGELPLVFGRGHPELGERIPQELLVHPIA